ncbi:Cytochrome c553 [Tranquillimonas alkanivorans]|uniref:Cytochrome c553 n=1 Tax=Tranquillimonas alkanivorans TaxID=441119 RepID=A0A1I5WV17_9RHOB|nr:Cytochrome c553 [Tranquillimonas alkanivorans]
MGTVFKGIALGVFATLLVGIAGWVTVVYTGAYNVAASDRHFDAVRWTLDTTMQRSIARRADGVELPESFPAESVAEGAGHYAESCAHCHGAPGREPAGWSRGMKPEPPHLVEAAAHWRAEEIRWIVENGIKMSGMPAFGAEHGAEEIVSITAFVSQLPGLSPEDYAALVPDGGGAHSSGEQSGGAHGGGAETE